MSVQRLSVVFLIFVAEKMQPICSSAFLQYRARKWPGKCKALGTQKLERFENDQLLKSLFKMV